MFRRLLCLFCAALLLFSVSTAFAVKAPTVHSYDFDLTFALNAEAFPRLLRPRISGYAELLNRLGLKGNITWSTKTGSTDLNAEVYFTSNPSRSYPFRISTTKSRLFITSPLLDNEELFFDKMALMAFSVKAQNTLNLPLPYFAFLYPYTTEYAFRPLAKSWNKIIAPSRKTGVVTAAQFEELSEKWAAIIQDDVQLQLWIYALMNISEVSEVIDNEFGNLPMYYEKVTGGEPLSVTVDKHSELWQDAAGNTLFSRRTEEDYTSLQLSLPASENGYIPSLTVRTQSDEETCGFGFSASVLRDPDFSSRKSAFSDEDNYFPYTDDGEYDEEVVDEEVVDEDVIDEEVVEEEVVDEEVMEEADGDEPVTGEDGDEDTSVSDRLLSLRAAGTGLPRKLPADSSFSVSAAVTGAVYPNYAFFLQGNTKKDGSVSVSLYKPGSAETAPVEIFRVFGTVSPVEGKEAPDFRKKSVKEAYNIFSLNDQTLAEFTAKIIPLAVRNLLSFVAEAPTASCQALLDDLTDLGVLGMLMN